MTSSPELPRGNQKHITESTPKKSEEKKPKEKLKLQNFKADEATRKSLKEKADKYTGGCVSKWLKLAGTKYEPK